MAAVKVIFNGVAYYDKSGHAHPITLVGNIGYADLGPGGGPIFPPIVPPEPPLEPPPHPEHPIVPEGGYPHPEHPIVLPPWLPPGGEIPPLPIDPPVPPDVIKPPPPEGGWGYHPDYGWGYFPGSGGKPQPIPPP